MARALSRALMSVLGRRPLDERAVPADGRALITRLEQMCSDCDGTGAFPDPDWEVWDDHERRLVAELRACGDDQPVLRQVIQARLTEHRATPPDKPREVACAGCEGVGTLPNADGMQLLTFVLRHLRQP